MRKSILTMGLLVCFSALFAQNTEQSGEYITYHDNGSKNAVFNMKKGVANGNVQFFYENGNKKEEGQFIEGNRNGKWIKWDESSNKIISEAHYNNGKKDGVWKIWDDNGVLRYQMEYKDGKKVGTWQQYDANGELISEKKF